jgi:hypothetical protein
LLLPVSGMRAFTLRLERALAQGAVLAAFSVNGCAGKADGTAPPLAVAGGSAAAGSGARPTVGGEAGAGGGGGGSLGGGGGDAEAGSSGVLVGELPALPLNAMECTGPEHDGGYVGRCCGEVKCLADNSGRCAPADTAELGSYGSGQCLCGGSPAQDKAGPYARDANNPSSPAWGSGACCYVVQSIGCEGRPLLVEGNAVVSPLTLRSDWLASAVRELLAG